MNGMIEGYTDNYIRVALPYHPALAGKIVAVRVGEFNGDYALGQAVDTQLSAMLPLLPVVNYCRT